MISIDKNTAYAAVINLKLKCCEKLPKLMELTRKFDIVRHSRLFEKEVDVHLTWQQLEALYVDTKPFNFALSL